MEPRSDDLDKPEWSFLELEASIDASLDSFIHDLITPRAEKDSHSVSEEAALEEALAAKESVDIPTAPREKLEDLWQQAK